MTEHPPIPDAPRLPYQCGLPADGKEPACDVRKTPPERRIKVCMTCLKEMTGRHWSRAEALAVFHKQAARLAEESE